MSTPIEIPDGAVRAALAAYNASRGSYEGETPADADDMRAATPAASGGDRPEPDARCNCGWGDVKDHLREECSPKDEEPQPPSAAPVSERARELLADEHRADCRHIHADRILNGRITTEDNRALRAIEQALTQQRGEAVYLIRGEFGGWTEQSKAAHEWWNGRENAPERRILYTTPQPSADAVRELVQRWRGSGKAIAYICADELESLLSAASGEGV